MTRKMYARIIGLLCICALVGLFLMGRRLVQPSENRTANDSPNENEAPPSAQILCMEETADSNSNVVDEMTSPYPLVELFMEGDSIESEATRVMHICQVLIKNYEKYLLEKYVFKTDLTDDEKRRKAIQNLEQSDMPTLEQTKELHDFGQVWNATMQEDRSLKGYDGVQGFIPQTEVFKKFSERRLYFRFYVVSGHIKSGVPVAKEEREAWKLNDEERGFLNQLIEESQIPAADPGPLYTSHYPLREEDKEFINQLIKGKGIKVPWSKE